METVKTEKQCRVCKLEKHISNFSKCRTRKDGYQPLCKSCWAEYRKNNRSKLSERDKLYKKPRKAHISEIARRHYIANKDLITKQADDWYRSPKGRISKLNSCHRYRAVIKQGNVTTEELQHLLCTSKNCYWCKESLEDKKVHIDHYFPISKGGLHSIENLVISCKKCNLSKSNKDPEVFAEYIRKIQFEKENYK